jgi:hypothetical protein
MHSGYTPERPIHGTRELGRVRHERASVAQPGVHEPALDPADAAVHHVARCNTVRACPRVRNGNLGNARNRWLGVNRSVLVKEAAVAMGGVFAQTDISCDVELRV